MLSGIGTNFSSIIFITRLILKSDVTLMQQPSHRHPQKYKKSPNPNKTARKLLKTKKEADKQPPILLNPPVKTHYAFHPHVSDFGVFPHRGQNKNRQKRHNPLKNPFISARCPEFHPPHAAQTAPPCIQKQHSQPLAIPTYAKHP